MRFEGATVKLATPGASGEELRRQFSQVSLEKLRGQLEWGEDEVLAFPSVTAIYTRSANGGRHGRLLLPHALTANEWNLYAHKREVPPRYQRPNDRARTPLSDALVAAISAANGTYVMSPSEGGTEQSLRTVSDFFFHGFQVASLKTKKKKSGVAAKRAALVRAALQPDGVGGDSPLLPAKREAKPPIPGVVYML